MAGDVDNDPLVLSVLSGPASGRLSINRTNPFPPIQATYTPTGVPTNNTDSFTYLVQANNAFYVTATVTINLVPPYYLPIAYGASFNTAWNEPVEVPLSATAPGGGALNYLILGQAAHGILSGTAPA